MGLESGNLRHGGIEIGARIDLSGVDQDLSQLETKLDRFARGTRLDLSARQAGPPAGGTSRGGTSPSASPLLMVDPLAGLSGAMGRIQARMGKSIAGVNKAIDGVIDNVGRIAKSSRVQEKFTRDTERAQAIAFKAGAVEFHGAHAARLGARYRGEVLDVQRPGGRIGALPADIRGMLGGVHFGGPPTLSRRGHPGAAAEDNPAAQAARAFAPAVAAGDRAAATLSRAGAELQRAAVQLQQAGAAVKAGGPTGGGHPLVLHPQVLDAAERFGSLPKGFHDATKGDFVAGSARQSPYFRRPRATAPPPGSIAGGIVPDAATGHPMATKGRRRRGAVGLPLAGQGELPADIAGAHKAVDAVVTAGRKAGKALADVGEGLRRAQAGLSAVGHAGAAAFNAVGQAVLQAQSRIDRIWKATAPIRGAGAVLVAPFALAARAVGLWDSRVGHATNALRVLGRGASALTAPLTAPFKAAAEAASGLHGMIGRLTAGIAAAGVASVAAMAVKGVKAAADLEESVDRVRTVFGKATGKVTEFASGMAGKFGRAKAELLEMEALFGTMLQHAGKGDGALADMSNTLGKRALDLASYWGKSSEEAGDAISKALSGSFRQMKQFGVILDDDAVKAKAVAMGLAKSGDDASRSAKQLATYQLILEQTAQAHGHLDRAANSTNHMLSEIWGRVENAAAALGEKLKPAFDEVLLLILDIQEGMAKWNVKVNSAIGGAAGVVQQFVHFLRQMWASWEDGIALVRVVWQQLKENTGDAISWLGQLFTNFFTWLSETWDRTFSDLAAKTRAAVADMFSDDNVAKFFGVEVAGKLAAGAGGIAAGGLAAPAPELKIPKLELRDTFRGMIDDLVAKIGGRKLDREAGGIVPRGVAGPDVDLPDKDGKAKKGRADRDHAGQLLGARELLDSLQRSVFDKDSKNIEQTAKAANQLPPLINKLIGIAARGTVAVLG